ncbi:hypothetical protein AGMMS50229_11760 [Campylobacterota bacterium]|nr:hypothetical protein AGMMS50229_11760 [Campylobacterota bacterium]
MKNQIMSKAKKLVIALAILSGVSLSAQCTEYQNGYFRRDGTYVQPHWKTCKDGFSTNNFSSIGNTNAFTGQSGSRANNYSLDAQNYGSGRTIYTGPKGGQYYYNDYGNKVYVPKR